MMNRKLCLCALTVFLLCVLVAGCAMAETGTFGVIYGTDTLNLSLIHISEPTRP